jgi:hypothetical protein
VALLTSRLCLLAVLACAQIRSADVVVSELLRLELVSYAVHVLQQCEDHCRLVANTAVNRVDVAVQVEPVTGTEATEARLMCRGRKQLERFLELEITLRESKKSPGEFYLTGTGQLVRFLVNEVRSPAVAPAGRLAAQRWPCVAARADVCRLCCPSLVLLQVTSSSDINTFTEQSCLPVTEYCANATLCAALWAHAWAIDNGRNNLKPLSMDARPRTFIHRKDEANVMEARKQALRQLAGEQEKIKNAIFTVQMGLGSD